MMTAPLDSFTRAVLRSPELGFLGRTTPTRRHTPLSAGLSEPASAGDTAWRARLPLRHPRSTWLSVAGRGAVVVKVRKDGAWGCRAAVAAGVARRFVRDRRVGGEKNCRRMVPTMVGGLDVVSGRVVVEGGSLS